MHITGLGRSFARAVWPHRLGLEKPGCSRPPRPWAVGRLKGHNSGWPGRLQLRPTGRRARRRTGLQPQVREDLLDHRRFQDRRNDLQLAAAVRAVLQTELEHALEQLGPARPYSAVMRTGRLALGGLCVLRGRLGLLRHPQCAHLGVGCQHTMEADQVQPRPRHQRGQPLHELQRRHHQVRGAVAPGGLERDHHLTGGVGLYAFVGQRGARRVAAQLFQRFAVVGRATHSRAQAEAVAVGALALLEVRLPGHCTLQRQHLLPGSWAEGDAAGTGRSLQRPKRTGFIRVAVVVGQVGRTLLFDEHPPTGEQLHPSGDDLVQHRLQRLTGRRGHFDELRRAHPPRHVLLGGHPQARVHRRRLRRA